MSQNKKEEKRKTKKEDSLAYSKTKKEAVESIDKLFKLAEKYNKRQLVSFDSPIELPADFIADLTLAIELIFVHGFEDYATKMLDMFKTKEVFKLQLLDEKIRSRFHSHISLGIAFGVREYGAVKTTKDKTKKLLEMFLKDWGKRCFIYQEVIATLFSNTETMNLWPLFKDQALVDRASFFDEISNSAFSPSVLQIAAETAVEILEDDSILPNAKKEYITKFLGLFEEEMKKAKEDDPTKSNVAADLAATAAKKDSEYLKIALYPWKPILLSAVKCNMTEGDKCDYWDIAIEVSQSLGSGLCDAVPELSRFETILARDLLSRVAVKSTEASIQKTLEHHGFPFNALSPTSDAEKPICYANAKFLIAKIWESFKSKTWDKVFLLVKLFLEDSFDRNDRTVYSLAEYLNILTYNPEEECEENNDLTAEEILSKISSAESLRNGSSTNSFLSKLGLFYLIFMNADDLAQMDLCMDIIVRTELYTLFSMRNKTFHAFLGEGLARTISRGAINTFAHWIEKMPKELVKKFPLETLTFKVSFKSEKEERIVKDAGIGVILVMCTVNDVNEGTKEIGRRLYETNPGLFYDYKQNFRSKPAMFGVQKVPVADNSSYAQWIEEIVSLTVVIMNEQCLEAYNSKDKKAWDKIHEDYNDLLDYSISIGLSIDRMYSSILSPEANFRESSLLHEVARAGSNIHTVLYKMDPDSSKIDSTMTLKDIPSENQNKTTLENVTPLHMASLYGNPDATRELFECGANPSLTIKSDNPLFNNRTSFDLAFFDVGFREGGDSLKVLRTSAYYLPDDFIIPKLGSGLKALKKMNPVRVVNVQKAIALARDMKKKNPPRSQSEYAKITRMEWIMHAIDRLLPENEEDEDKATEMLREFLAKESIDIRDTTPAGDTLLHIATKSWFNTAIVPLLCLGCDVDASNEHNETCFDLAIETGNTEGMRLLTTSNTNYKHVNVLDISEKKMKRLIECATTFVTYVPESCKESWKVLKVLIVLLSIREDAKSHLPIAMDFLAKAKKFQAGEVLIELLDEDAMKYVCTKTNTLFYCVEAFFNPNENDQDPLLCIEQLVKKGADLSVYVKGGGSCLHIIADRDEDCKFIKWLLSQYPEEVKLNFDVSQSDPDFPLGIMTPLHIAIARGNIEMVKLMIENGADIEVGFGQGARKSTKTITLDERQVVKGDTALFIAIRFFQQEKDEIIKLLLEANADVNAVNDNGDTPIFVAMHNTNISVVNTLINEGADLTFKNSHGKTPLRYLKSSPVRDEAIVAVLNRAELDKNRNQKLIEIKERKERTAKEKKKRGTYLKRKEEEAKMAEERKERERILEQERRKEEEEIRRKEIAEHRARKKREKKEAEKEAQKKKKDEDTTSRIAQNIDFVCTSCGLKHTVGKHLNAELRLPYCDSCKACHLVDSHFPDRIVDRVKEFNISCTICGYEHLPTYPCILESQIDDEEEVKMAEECKERERILEQERRKEEEIRRKEIAEQLVREKREKEQAEKEAQKKKKDEDTTSRIAQNIDFVCTSCGLKHAVGKHLNAELRLPYCDSCKACHLVDSHFPDRIVDRVKEFNISCTICGYDHLPTYPCILESQIDDEEEVKMAEERKERERILEQERRKEEEIRRKEIAEQLVREKREKDQAEKEAQKAKVAEELFRRLIETEEKKNEARNTAEKERRIEQRKRLQEEEERSRKEQLEEESQKVDKENLERELKTLADIQAYLEKELQKITEQRAEKEKMLEELNWREQEEMEKKEVTPRRIAQNIDFICTSCGLKHAVDQHLNAELRFPYCDSCKACHLVDSHFPDRIVDRVKEFNISCTICGYEHLPTYPCILESQIDGESFTLICPYCEFSWKETEMKTRYDCISCNRFTTLRNSFIFRHYVELSDAVLPMESTPGRTPVYCKTCHLVSEIAVGENTRWQCNSCNRNYDIVSGKRTFKFHRFEQCVKKVCGEAVDSNGIVCTRCGQSCSPSNRVICDACKFDFNWIEGSDSYQVELVCDTVLGKEPKLRKGEMRAKCRWCDTVFVCDCTTALSPCPKGCDPVDRMNAHTLYTDHRVSLAVEALQKPKEVVSLPTTHTVPSSIVIGQVPCFCAVCHVPYPEEYNGDGSVKSSCQICRREATLSILVDQYQSKTLCEFVEGDAAIEPATKPYHTRVFCTQCGEISEVLYSDNSWKCPNEGCTPVPLSDAAEDYFFNRETKAFASFDDAGIHVVCGCGGPVRLESGKDTKCSKCGIEKSSRQFEVDFYVKKRRRALASSGSYKSIESLVSGPEVKKLKEVVKQVKAAESAFDEDIFMNILHSDIMRLT